MPSSYNGVAANIVTPVPVTLSLPIDGDPSNAASVSTPGPLETIADYLAYLQAAPAITTPALVVGNFIFGAPKLSWWVDIQGNVHIEGQVGGLSGSSPITLWAAATLPVGVRPLGNVAVPCQTSNGTHVDEIGLAVAGSNGSLIVGCETGGINPLGALIYFTYNPRIPVGP